MLPCFRGPDPLQYSFNMDDPFGDHYGVAPPVPAPALAPAQAPAAEGSTAALFPFGSVSMPEYVYAVRFDRA